MWKLAIAITLAVAVGVDGALMDLLDSCYGSNEGGVYRAPCTNQTGFNQTGVVSMCHWSFNTEASTCSMINFITQRHNELRRNVAMGNELRGVGGAQPRAANMEKLVWDEGLRDIASTFAVDCIQDPVKCNEESDDDDAGVSTFTAVSNADNIDVAWKKTIDIWYNEVPKFKAANIPIFANNVGTDNYTRMTWALTNKIGCVSAVYGEVTQNTLQRRILVCAYGPKGNVVGQSMYNKGTQCSGCLKNCFNGALCDFS